MRRPLLIIAGSILLLIGAFIARKAIGSLDQETQLSHYANLPAARQSGIIERGWVPEFLPAGSKDITEIHNLDTNTGTGTFRFPSADLDAFKAQARQLTGAEVKEVSTITYVVYARDLSRFELVLTPDPQKADAMVGVWGMKPIR
ncbi:MAG: hypothetical protein NTU71_06355 [Verrucomicrobia bacterium]|nr:hypothetical protein [Verrucomicrobiota bacterium]